LAFRVETLAAGACVLGVFLTGLAGAAVFGEAAGFAAFLVVDLSAIVSLFSFSDSGSRGAKANRLSAR
jgi:hypothetical protein